MTDPQFNSSSFDPSARDDLTGVLRYVLTKFLQGTDGMLPAQVIATDRKTVSVQPLISMITTSNEIVQRSVIPSIPVQWPGGGGFVMSWPLRAGDFGWIKSNDRDISLFLQSLRRGSPVSSPPNTARKWSFSDAVFIPDTMGNGVNIAGGDAANAVIQNLAGTVKIAWASDHITTTPNIGIGGAPNANAALDVQSTTKALLFPRMSTAQKNAITATNGMAVYDTSLGRMSFYESGSWS